MPLSNTLHEENDEKLIFFVVESAVNKSRKQAASFQPPLSSCGVLKKMWLCLLSEVRVYLRADMWELIDLINNVQVEYHKMMRTS